MIKILLIIALTCFSCTTTPAKWTKAEKTKEACWLVLHAVDYKQTQYAMDRPDEFKELSPALGSHPSKGRLNTVALAGGILHPVVTHFIWKEYRDSWQNWTLTFKVGAVAWNFHVGAKVEF